VDDFFKQEQFRVEWIWMGQFAAFGEMSYGNLEIHNLQDVVQITNQVNSNR
jgi:hypothetical protein